MAKRVFLKRSNVADKLPEDKSTISYGELLVNYSAGKEFIGLKNSNDEYAKIKANPDAADVKFSGKHSDELFTGTTVEESVQQIEKAVIDDEKITSSALNDLNTRIDNIPAATVTGIKSGDNILSLSGTELVSTLSIDYDTENKLIQLKGNGGTVFSSINATAFVKDGMLAKAELISKDGKTYIRFTFNTDGGTTPIDLDVTSLIDTYTAADGGGLILTDHAFSVNTDKIATTELVSGTKTAIIGTSGNTKIDDTVWGAKKYADDAVSTAKATIGNYKINNKAISTNPTLDATDINVTGHADSGFTGTTVNESINQIEDEMLKNEHSISSSLNDLNTRIKELPLGDTNVIEGIQRNGTDLAITNKKVNITVPESAGEISFDNSKHTLSGVTGKTVERSVLDIESAIATTNSNVSNKVDKVDSKGLSTNDYTTDEKNKLSGIASGAQVNKIESVKLNGTALSIATDKSVDIVPNASGVTFDKAVHSDTGFTGETVQESIKQVEKAIIDNESTLSASLNDLKTAVNSKVDKVDGMGLSTNDYTTEEKTKLLGITSGAQVNVIEGIQRNGADLTVDANKKVNVIVPTKGSEITFDGTHSLVGLTGTTLTAAISNIETAIADNEKAGAAALNVLNKKLSEIPAATVTGIESGGDILTLSGTQLVAKVTASYDSDKHEIYLKGLDDKIISTIKASAFIKDGMISNVAFDANTNILTITFNSDAGKEPIDIDLSTLMNTYSAGTGLVLSDDGKFSIDSTVATTGTVETAKSALIGNTSDSSSGNTIWSAKKYADDVKSTIGDYTVNGYKISGNPVIDAAHIKVTGHSDELFTGTTIDDSIKQLEKAFIDDEKVVSSSLNDLNTRLDDKVSNDDLTTKLAIKVDAESGKGLSTNDYTTDEKTKLSGIAEGANKTVVDSELSSGSTNPVQNKIIKAALDEKVSKSDLTTKDISRIPLLVTITIPSDADYDIVENTIFSNEFAATKVTIDSDYAKIRANMDSKNIMFKFSIDGASVLCSSTWQGIPSGTTDDIGFTFGTNSLYNYGIIIKQNGDVYFGYTAAYPANSSEINYDGGHPLTGLTGSNVSEAIKDIEQVIVDNELTTSSSLNDLNTRISGLSFTAADIDFTGEHYSSNYTGTTVEESIVTLENGLDSCYNKVNNKVDAVNGKGLSTNDYTNDEKTKLAKLTPDLYCIKRTVETLLSGYTGMGTTTGVTSQSVTLDAGKFYIIGRAGSLTINLPSSAATDCLEYCCQFYVPSSSFTLTMPSGIYWQNGAVPTFEASTCCQLVIVNNCATIGSYKATS